MCAMVRRMWIANSHPHSPGGAKQRFRVRRSTIAFVALVAPLAGCVPGAPVHPDMSIPADAQRLHVSADWFGSGLHLDPATLRAGDVYIEVDDDLGIVMLVETASGSADSPPALVSVDDQLLGDCDSHERQQAENPQDGVLGYCGTVIHKVVLSEGSYAVFIAGEGVRVRPAHSPTRSAYDFVPRPEDERPTTSLEVMP
jgi:hypothetical protein